MTTSKEHNDAILERMRGVPMREGDWRDKFHPQNPNVPNANDNQPAADPPRSP